MNKQVKDPMSEYAITKLRMFAERPLVTGHDMNKFADQQLVRVASNAMQEKLEIARDKGRGGWWDVDTCDVEYLKKLLADHLDKGDMVDIMNLAAMVYFRETAGGLASSEYD